MLSNRHSLKRSGLFFRSFHSICVRGVAYCLCSGRTVLLRLSLRSIHFEVRTEDYLKLKILLPSTANQLLLCVWNTKLTTCERKARQRRFFIRYVHIPNGMWFSSISGVLQQSKTNTGMTRSRRCNK